MLKKRNVKARKLIQAKLLTPMQLRMLDIGAPVIVACESLTGETVEVRLQTAKLEGSSRATSRSARSKADKENDLHERGCWLNHGAYVAIMSVEAK